MFRIAAYRKLYHAPAAMAPTRGTTTATIDAMSFTSLAFMVIASFFIPCSKGETPVFGAPFGKGGNGGLPF